MYLILKLICLIIVIILYTNKFWVKVYFKFIRIESYKYGEVGRDKKKLFFYLFVFIINFVCFIKFI